MRSQLRRAALGDGWLTPEHQRRPGHGCRAVVRVFEVDHVAVRPGLRVFDDVVVVLHRRADDVGLDNPLHPVGGGLLEEARLHFLHDPGHAGRPAAVVSHRREVVQAHQVAQANEPPSIHPAEHQPAVGRLERAPDAARSEQWVALPGPPRQLPEHRGGVELPRLQRDLRAIERDIDLLALARCVHVSQAPRGCPYRGRWPPPGPRWPRPLASAEHPPGRSPTSCRPLPARRYRGPGASRLTQRAERRGAA